jgi:hypothetical protein
MCGWESGPPELPSHENAASEDHARASNRLTKVARASSPQVKPRRDQIMFLVASPSRLNKVKRMSNADLTNAVFSLPVAQRIALADRLYASVPPDWQTQADHAWMDEAMARSSEMDADPSLEMSFEDFKKGVQTSRPRE